MKALTVRDLKDWLDSHSSTGGPVKDEMEVCVWLKDGAGRKAERLEDLTWHGPDQYDEYGFIAFHRMPDED